ncbi:hypothetical protein JB92DRAFT_2647304, partial [Gautieria morchelliformis]
TYYLFYDTVLETLTGTFHPMEIRFYTPLGEKLLCEDTIAHVVGCVYAASSTKVLMDALSVTAYPGDPSSDEYEDGVPNNKVVVIWGLAAVLNNAETDPDSNT